MGSGGPSENFSKAEIQRSSCGKFSPSTSATVFERSSTSPLIADRAISNRSDNGRLFPDCAWLIISAIGGTSALFTGPSMEAPPTANVQRSLSGSEYAPTSTSGNAIATASFATVFGSHRYCGLAARLIFGTATMSALTSRPWSRYPMAFLHVSKPLHCTADQWMVKAHIGSEKPRPYRGKIPVLLQCLPLNPPERSRQAARYILRRS